MQEPEILLIEDDIATALDLSEIIGSALGKRCKPISSIELERTLESARPDLVILDCPVSDEQFEKCFQLLSDREDIICIVTSHNRITENYRQQVAAAVEKPVDQDELVEAIRLVMSKRSEDQTTPRTETDVASGP